MKETYEKRADEIIKEMEESGNVTCCKCDKKIPCEDSYFLPIVMKFFCEECKQ